MKNIKYIKGFRQVPVGAVRRYNSMILVSGLIGIIGLLAIACTYHKPTSLPEAFKSPMTETVRCYWKNPTTYICNSPERIIEALNDPTRPKVVYTFKAIQTRYSRADSCHYPAFVNGKWICKTAIGKDTLEGQTVACPRNLKLGTKIMIFDEVFTCEDRYNKSLDKKRPLPTIDIFYEADSPIKPPSLTKGVTVSVLSK